MVLDARPEERGSVLDDARSGGEWGISCLYLQYHPLVLRYLRHHAPAAAEDLASEVWLAVARQVASFQGDEDCFRAWIFTIARRRVVDHYRRGARRAPVIPLERSFDVAGTTDVAEAATQAATAQDAVEALVGALPPQQSEVILLRVVADLSVEQVATIMGRSPGSVRVLQHRALSRLRHLWETAVTE